MNSFSGITFEKYHMFHYYFFCVKSSVNYTLYRFDISSFVGIGIF